MRIEKLINKYGVAKGMLVASSIVFGSLVYFLVFSPILNDIICNNNVINWINYLVIFFSGLIFRKSIFEYLFSSSMIFLSVIIILSGMFFMFFGDSVLIYFKEKYGCRCKA